MAERKRERETIQFASSDDSSRDKSRAHKSSNGFDEMNIASQATIQQDKNSTTRALQLKKTRAFDSLGSP